MTKPKIFLIILVLIALSLFGYALVRTFSGEKQVEYAKGTVTYGEGIGDCYVTMEREGDGELYIDGRIEYKYHNIVWCGGSDKPVLTLEIIDSKPVFTYDNIDEAGQAFMDWIDRYYIEQNK